MAADPQPTAAYWDHSECVGTEYCQPRCPRYVDDEGLPYVVGPYEPDDLASLVAMYETIEPESRTLGLPPPSRSAIQAWLEGLVDRGWNLVARHVDRVVGHVGVAPADADDPEIVVFVHHEFQNRGLGTELLQQTIAYAADRDYDGLTLSVSRGNRRAVNVYRNVGFEFEDEGDWLTPGDLELRLPLSAPIADRVRRPPAER